MITKTERKSLRQFLVERIRTSGPMSFAEYMRSCLYDPKFGYYMRTPGERRPDYYTSVDMSPIFGRLIARQLAEMWERMSCPTHFAIVECGAASGDLARQILDFALAQRPEFYAGLHYSAVEISQPRRDRAGQALVAHISGGHASVSSELPDAVREGCILANEFVDALPVHRIVMRGGALFEIFVDAHGDDLVERVGPLSSPDLSDFFARQNVVLHEGQQAEVGLAACRWIEDVGRRLARGFVLIIDYGREARELYDERHMRGTLLACSGHRASEEFYRAPGEQDLTSHANFTALDLWGRTRGLVRTGLTSQTNFLLALARSSGFADLNQADSGDLGGIRSRLQFKSLIFPEGMGEAFQVMVQHKGIPAPELSGLAPL